MTELLIDKHEAKIKMLENAALYDHARLAALEETVFTGHACPPGDSCYRCGDCRPWTRACPGGGICSRCRSEMWLDYEDPVQGGVYRCDSCQKDGLWPAGKARRMKDGTVQLPADPDHHPWEIRRRVDHATQEERAEAAKAVKAHAQAGGASRDCAACSGGTLEECHICEGTSLDMRGRYEARAWLYAMMSLKP